MYPNIYGLCDFFIRKFYLIFIFLRENNPWFWFFFHILLTRKGIWNKLLCSRFYTRGVAKYSVHWMCIVVECFLRQAVMANKTYGKKLAQQNNIASFSISIWKNTCTISFLIIKLSIQMCLWTEMFSILCYHSNAKFNIPVRKYKINLISQIIAKRASGFQHQDFT